MMYKLALQSDSDDDRARPRHRVILELADGASSAFGAAVIHNLSTTGLLLETSASLSTGCAIDLDLPHGGRVSATIAWQSDEYFGATFSVPLAASTVRKVVAESPVIFPNFGDVINTIADRQPLPAPLELAVPAADRPVTANGVPTMILMSLALWGAIGTSMYALFG